MSITESSSDRNLEEMTISELLLGINQEDQVVISAVNKVIPKIEILVKKVVDRLRDGGRLFYIGAGTSGRLGILDASEIPPTFGVPYDVVIGMIAGGDAAIRKAVESAEDDYDQAWKDLIKYGINDKDTVVGIAASGRTPYVIGGVKDARQNGLLTACITCNPDSRLEKEAEIPIVAVVGPEFVTGSTRMKSGTAQKLILNMITTTTMIKMGHIRGNKMVDMQLTNKKLVDRGARMIMEELHISRRKAKNLLLKHGSVRKVLLMFDQEKK
ncbi:MAG: N-acetylmuramic acid 6-phosphate etherase [Bacteroidetes bacterium]|nr:N-acetylmuramic acid 6-phosphate etherase [Bacteroidota bacterium]